MPWVSINKMVTILYNWSKDKIFKMGNEAIKSKNAEFYFLYPRLANYYNINVHASKAIFLSYLQI